MGMTLLPEIQPLAERLSLDPDSGCLVGSVCNSCLATSWPSRALCQRCGSLTKIGHPFSQIGTLLSFAKTWVPRPGVPSPYVLGQVELDGCIVSSHIRELSENDRVPLRVRVVIPREPDGALSFWFRPAP